MKEVVWRTKLEAITALQNAMNDDFNRAAQ